MIKVWNILTRRDEDPRYIDHMNAINGRAGCSAVCTSKRELENYVHFEAINEAYAVHNVALGLTTHFGEFDDVPAIVAQAVHDASGGAPWAQVPEDARRRKMRNAKSCLNGLATSKMSVARIAETDPADEIRGWLRQIRAMMDAVPV